MKLLKLQKINNALKKYSSIMVSSLLLMSKKENLSNIIFYSIMSLLGYFMIKKDNDENVEQKDWKEFLNSELKKNKDDDTVFNEDLEEIHSDINNNIKELKKMMKSDKKNLDDIKEEDEDSEEEDDLLIDDNFDINKKKMNKIIDKNFNEKAYPNNIEDLSSEYNRKKKDYLFKLKVNDNNKNMPIFNLRSSDKIDFYWNFHLHNSDNSKINNLILCRDIHQWMNNSSISNEDLENQCYPFYIIIRDRKTNNEIMIFEAYKIFVYPDENGNKQAFITKGDNYKTIEEILNILIELGYIKDLLNNKEYESYNLSGHNSVILFLNNLLSHFLPYESTNGEVINIDLKQFNENKTTFDYFYHTNLMESELFNTNI